MLFDTGTGNVTRFGPDRRPPSHQPESRRYRCRAMSTRSSSLTRMPITASASCRADGRAQFPERAKSILPQAEFDFWTDEAKAGINDMMKMMVAGTRKNFMRNRDRMVFVKDGQEFLPGIMAISTPGHTVGHTSVQDHVAGPEALSISATSRITTSIVMEKPRLPNSCSTPMARKALQRGCACSTCWRRSASRWSPYHFPMPRRGLCRQAGRCAIAISPRRCRTVL